jgi:hypothetical protein
MNLTLDDYILSLEDSARELPAVLAEWDEIDPELQDGYIDQLSWLIRVQRQVALRARDEGREREISERLIAANAAMGTLRESLLELMGIKLPAVAVPPPPASGPPQASFSYAAQASQLAPRIPLAA